MGERSRFGDTYPLLTYALGYDPADQLQQVPTDYPDDLATDVSTVIEVARQVDVTSPVSDLALGITPTAFGASPAWTNVANLTDGSGSTYASGPNYVESGTVSKGFSIDLGAPAAVAQMLLTVTPYSPYPYNIESSPDNSTWTDRPYTRTGPVASVYTYTLTGGPITARYWRIRRSYHGYIGPQRIYTWAISGSTTTSSTKTWFGTDQVNDGDDTTYEESDGVDDVLRMLFSIDRRLNQVRLLVGSEFSGSVTYELQRASELDFSDATTVASFSLTTTGSYTGDWVTFTWEPLDAYSLWQVVSSADENRRFYTIEAFEPALELSAYQPLDEKDQPNGYAGLDADGQVPVAELPLIEELLTAETDDTLRLAPDGAGGVEWATGGSGGAVAVAEDGSVVIATATELDFRHGLDVTDAGGGVGQIAVDEGELTHNSLAGLTTGDPHTQYALDSDLPTSSAGPDADDTVDAAGAAGTAGTFARHLHGHKLATSAGPGADIAVDSAGAAGATGSVARTGHGHQLVTTAGPGADITVDVAGAAGSTGSAARAGHGHKVSTYSSTPVADGGAGSAGTSGDAPARGSHKHPGDLVGIEFVIDGGGVVPTTGSKGFLEVPFACTIVAARLAADLSGTAVVDIKKATYSGLFSTTSIVSATPPTLSGPAQKSEDTTLSSWTTTIAAGDWLEFSLTSVGTLTRLTVSLTVRRT